MLMEHRLKNLEVKLGLFFENPNLLEQALTHSSYAFEQNRPLTDNERLEFFGDAVLKLAISEHLYKRFPNLQEGELTKIRAVIVSDTMLAKKAAALGLGDYILLGNTEQRSGGSNKESTLANTLEAIIGAYYLDQKNIQLVNEFIVKILADIIEEGIQPSTVIDAKSALQEYAQKIGIALPRYTVLAESGPDHAKTFFIKATLETKTRKEQATAQGKTKKDAEQAAARKILKLLD
jgi:ribonuclease III